MFLTQGYAVLMDCDDAGRRNPETMNTRSSSKLPAPAGRLDKLDRWV